MIDSVISLLLASEKINSSSVELNTCMASLSGIFEDEDGRFELDSSYLSSDLASSVNLVLMPDESFETIFHIDDEIADLWYVLNGLHHFQMSQLFRYREASVLRFVATIFTGGATTGSMYITGKKYQELAVKYEKEQHELASWTGTESWRRFQAGNPTRHA
jgi:hypothetical protein